MPARELAGRRLVVTGASGALGGAIAAELRGRGALVVGLARGAGAGIVRCDITDAASVRAAIRTASELLGGIDGVVHCAGIGEPTDVGQEPSDADQRIMDVNLWGAWRVTSAALSELVAARGQVVLVASVLAYVSAPLSGSYGVSKRALAAYADALRAEYGSHLAVTTVYPGHVDTPMQDGPRAAGVSMDDKVPLESVEDVVGTVVTVLTAAVPPRDVGTTPLGEAGLYLARRLPGLIGGVVDNETRGHADRGGLAAPLAAGLVGRIADAPEGRQDPLAPPAVAASLERIRRVGAEVVARLARAGPAVGEVLDPLLAGAVWGILDPLLGQVADVLGELPAGGATDLVDPDELAVAQQRGREMIGRIGEVLLAGLVGPVPAGPDSPAQPSLVDPRVIATAVVHLQSLSHSVVGGILAEATDAPRT